MTVALDAFSSCRWLSVRNDAATPVPPHGVMEVTGIDSDEQCFVVTRPTAASLLNVLVNGPQAIPAGGYGQGTRSEPVQVLFETTDGTPTLDEDWGTASGSWKLAEGNLGFRYQGATDGSTAWWAFLGVGHTVTGDIIDAAFQVAGKVNTSNQVLGDNTKAFATDVQVGWSTAGDHYLRFAEDTAFTGHTTYVHAYGTALTQRALWLNTGVEDNELWLLLTAGPSSSNLAYFQFGATGPDATYPPLVRIQTDSGGSTEQGQTGTYAGLEFTSGWLTGGTLSVSTTNVADNSVTMAKLADLAGLSVIGRAANTTGDPAAITASTQYNVLRYDGTQIGWGTVNIASTNAVTGTLPIGNGGTGQSSNTKGDLLVGTGTIWSKRAVGTNGYVLTADSTETDGVKWANSVAPAGVGWTDPISLDFSNFSTGATTNTINTGYTLPAGGVLLGAVLKTTEAFGGGSITSYSLDLVVNGNNFISAYDGFAAVSGTNFAWEGEDSPYAGPVDFGSTTAIQIKATASHNLDTATAGAVTVYLKVSTLP